MQSIAERLEKAQQYKEAGNDFFREGLFSRAKSQYGRCLAYCTCLPGSARGKTGYESFHTPKPNGPAVTEDEDAFAANLEMVCHQNIATCLLKLELPADAIQHCDKAISIAGEERAWKAKMRKGEAYLQMGRSDDAKDIFQKLLSKTTDEGVKATLSKHIKKAERHMKIHQNKEKKLYKNMFGEDS